MINQNDMMVIQIARYKVFVEHDPYFHTQEVGLTRLQDRLILSHNGSLTPDQKKTWGRDAYKTAGGFKTSKLQKPANILPCLILAKSVNVAFGIDFSNLTIGAQAFKEGRYAVTYAAAAIRNSLLSQNDAISRQLLFKVWNWVKEKEGTEAVAIAVGFEEMFDAWLRISSVKQIVTPELEKERMKSGQWGEW